MKIPNFPNTWFFSRSFYAKVTKNFSMCKLINLQLQNNMYATAK